MQTIKSGPLHTVTLCTRDLSATLRFYAEAGGMTVTGPLPTDDATGSLQRRLWGIPETVAWDAYLLARPHIAGTTQIRLLHLQQETPSIRATLSPVELAPFSLGFATTNLAAWEAQLSAGGFPPKAQPISYPVPRPDGTKFQVTEMVFACPDWLHAVLIEREAGVAPMGPVDANGQGGPVYSAQTVERMDDLIAFYTALLGYEKRIDMTIEARSALGLPPGTKQRVARLYAPGAMVGHIALTEYFNCKSIPAAAPPRPPQRGLAMWSFPVDDAAAAHEKAQAGIPIVAGPVAYESAELGRHQALTLLAPNGFLIEMFQLGASG